MRSLMLCLCFAAGAFAQAADFFVAPDGSDLHSGSKDQPFATLERARDAVRALKTPDRLAGPITIYLRGGLYQLPRTLKLSADDSGTEQTGITYRAFEQERPVLIGGRRITGFKPGKGSILEADLAAQGITANFRQLFCNGRQMQLARYPNFDPQNPYGGGWAYADGKPVPMYAEVPDEDKHSLHYQTQDTRSWAHPEEGEVFVFPRYNWWNNIVRIQTIDPATRRITLAKDCSYPIRPTDRYYVRGLREELDAPGEWYLDAQTHKLSFWPPADAGELTVYAPELKTLLEIGPGTAFVTFRGITFECCEGTAIALKDTRQCLVAGCAIRNVGDYHGSGVSIGGGKHNGVAGCDISETGSHGVSISGGDRITLTPAENYADNNYIHHVGVFYKQGVGVSLSGCGNRASHNLIHDGPRMGIMFAGNNLLIDSNHIRHVNLETADTGAVYTGGRDWIGSRGTVIRHNYFHDILGYGQEDGKWVSPHYAWGVYLDDNTGGVDVIGNIVARCVRGLVHFHNARDNRIENNILVGGKLQQIEANGWTSASRNWQEHLPTMIKGYESVAGQPAWKAMRHMDVHPTKAVGPDDLIMSGNVVQRNILVYHDPDARLYKLSRMPFDRNRFDHNLAWHGGKPVLTGQSKVEEGKGPNLAPNPGFEQGEPGKEPSDWKWQIRPKDSVAVSDTKVKRSGERSLRFEGRGTAADPKGRELSPNYVSADIPAKPGQWYRLTAQIKAAAAGTKCSLMVQAYKSDVFFWAKDITATAEPEWKLFDISFKYPAPGDSNWKDEMKSFRIRIDVRQPDGTLWVDDVTLREAHAVEEWSAWQALGQDTHSIIADPRFVDPAKDDYRLAPDSPAWKLGFQPIPVEKIGPYASELRASWPIVEAEGAREKPLMSQK